MYKIAKKFWIILIFCLSLPFSVLSAEFAGGTGEPEDPYRIATAEQLISIGLDYLLLEKHYILIEDIDLDPNLPGGRVFTDALITQDESEGVSSYGGYTFRGVLDGQDHTIANLHIEGQYGYTVGLFGMLSGTVKDLHFTDVVISGSPCGAIAGRLKGMVLRCTVTGYVSGAENIGGLAGSNSRGSLMNCEAKVQVIGDLNVGGMVGLSSGGSLVDCKADVQVIGSENVGGMVGGGPGHTLLRCEVEAEVSGQKNVGGLVGRSSDGQFIECRTTGIVSGSNNVGGIIGDSWQTMILRSSAVCEVSAEETAGGLAGHAIAVSVLSDCYFQGSIAGSTIGGLAGEALHDQIMNCYAACELIGLESESRDPVVGGLFGDTINPGFAPTTVGSFWDEELSGIEASTGSDTLERGMGLTTEQMWDEEVFRNAGWDFDHVWKISEGEYLKLQWEEISELEN
ncbi:MAG: hypothetical protein GY774_25305 [Planctomycetes bacterium]|nr:hypothetical protein [Planctomycetota bacterium]